MPDQPIVVLTFDDSHESIYNTAYKAMKATDEHFVGTHFLPDKIAYQPYMVTTGQLREMEKNGWETAGHCVTHENLTLLSDEAIRQQIRRTCKGEQSLRLREKNLSDGQRKKTLVLCTGFLFSGGHTTWSEQLKAIWEFSTQF